jgi:hypothetical protein
MAERLALRRRTAESAVSTRAVLRNFPGPAENVPGTGMGNAFSDYYLLPLGGDVVRGREGSTEPYKSKSPPCLRKMRGDKDGAPRD